MSDVAPPRGPEGASQVGRPPPTATEITPVDAQGRPQQPGERAPSSMAGPQLVTTEGAAPRDVPEGNITMSGLDPAYWKAVLYRGGSGLAASREHAARVACALLGLSPTAGTSTFRPAYMALMAKVHPDKAQAGDKEQAEALSALLVHAHEFVQEHPKPLKEAASTRVVDLWFWALSKPKPKPKPKPPPTTGRGEPGRAAAEEEVKIQTASLANLEPSPPLRPKAGRAQTGEEPAPGTPAPGETGSQPPVDLGGPEESVRAAGDGCTGDKPRSDPIPAPPIGGGPTAQHPGRAPATGEARGPPPTGPVAAPAEPAMTGAKARPSINAVISTVSRDLTALERKSGGAGTMPATDPFNTPPQRISKGPPGRPSPPGAASPQDRAADSTTVRSGNR